MIVVDRMLAGGLRFVLSQLKTAAEAELDDEARLRERLLAAQLELEQGELSEEAYAELERGIVARLGELRAARREPAGRVIGAEAEVAPGVEVGRPAARPRRSKPRRRRARRQP